VFRRLSFRGRPPVHFSLVLVYDSLDSGTAMASASASNYVSRSETESEFGFGSNSQSAGKSSIPQVPPASWLSAPVTCTHDPAEVAWWIEQHVHARVTHVGLDTESTISWERGVRNHLSLIQLAVPGGAALIIDVAKWNRLPRAVFTLLQDPRIEKCCIGNESLELQRRWKLLNLQRVMDVQSLAVQKWELDELPSTQLLADFYLPDWQFTKSRELQQSDWGRRPLSAGQLKYAADDARLALGIRIAQLAEDHTCLLLREQQQERKEKKRLQEQRQRAEARAAAAAAAASEQAKAEQHHREQVERYHQRLQEQREEAKRHAARENLSSSALFCTHRLLAEGKFRLVYPGNYNSGPRNGQSCVIKVFRSGCVFEKDFFRFDIRSIEKAVELVGRWNLDHPDIKPIQVNSATVWEENGGKMVGQCMLVEPFIQNWQRFNSNCGWVNGEQDNGWIQLAQALSHYSYHITGGKFVLCDLQGGVTRKGLVLSDPVIHSRNRMFGVTDLGTTES
jgi:hypothetical protein